jgi:prepilin-type N-terminal cleavage/methylation domain-containing protein
MKNQKGFTLIEMLVVIFILALVSTAMIYQFREGDKQKRVNLSADAVSLALRTAQNYTLSGRQIPPSAQAPRVRGAARCTGAAVNNAASAYWVEFNSSSPTFNLMALDDCGAIMRIQSYQLTGRTSFRTANPFVTVVGPVNNLAVRFDPPFGNMTIATILNPAATDFDTFTTTTLHIQSEDGTRERAITVDGVSGKIE